MIRSRYHIQYCWTALSFLIPWNDYATDQFYSSGAIGLFFFSLFPFVCCIIIIIIIIRISSNLTNRSCNKSLTSRAFYSNFFPPNSTTKYLGTVVSRARTSPVSSIFPPYSLFLGARSLGHTAILISYARASSYWPSLHSNVAICPICPALQEKTLSHGGGSQKVPYAYAAILCTPYPPFHSFPVHSAASEAKCPLGRYQPAETELKRHALPMHLSMLLLPTPCSLYPSVLWIPRCDDAVGPPI